MKRRRLLSIVIYVVLIVFLYGCIFSLQNLIDSSKRKLMKRSDYQIILPKPKILKMASLGHTTLVADLYWLRLIQYVGTMVMFKQVMPDLYRQANFITDLDNHFQEAYYYPSVILTVDRYQPENILKLLKKGRANLPNDYRLAYLLGFVLYFIFGDHEESAKNLEDAARLYNFPTWAVLAAKIRNEKGEPEVALSFLLELRSQVPEYWKSFMDDQIKRIQGQVNLKELNKKIDEYYVKSGKYPESFEELFSAGIMRREDFPEEPFGGVYSINPLTKRAQSSVDYGMEIYKPTKEQEEAIELENFISK